MKTTIILTGMIPALATARAFGAFNAAAAERARRDGQALRVAANDDRVVAGALQDALGRLAEARTFEDQQQAMDDVARESDDLLGALSAGTYEKTPAPVRSAHQLAAGLVGTAASLQDVFHPSRATLRSIRADASELASLVDAEVMEGVRDAEDALTAARVFDAADHAASAGHAVRQDGLATVVALSRRLAA